MTTDMPEVIYADKSGEFYRGYYFTDTEQYIRSDKHEELKAIAEKMAGALQQYELSIQEATNDYIKLSAVAKKNGLMATWREAEETAAYLSAMLNARKSALTEYNKYKGDINEI